MKTHLLIIILFISYSSMGQSTYVLQKQDIPKIEECIKQYEDYLDTLGMSGLDKVYSIKIDEQRLKKMISISFIFSKSGLIKNIAKSKYAFKHNDRFVLLFGNYVDSCNDSRVIDLSIDSSPIKNMYSNVWNDVDGDKNIVKWIELRPALVYFPNHFRSIKYTHSSDMPESRSPIILITEEEFYLKGIEWNKEFKKRFKKKK